MALLLMVTRPTSRFAKLKFWRPPDDPVWRRPPTETVCRRSSLDQASADDIFEATYEPVDPAAWDAPMTKNRKTKSEKHSWLIDSLEHVLFPHQESEEEQESFTPEGRQRVDDWLSEHMPQNPDPRCPGCGFTMIQEFDERPVNNLATAAIPNGRYRYAHCKPLKSGADWFLRKEKEGR